MCFWKAKNQQKQERNITSWKNMYIYIYICLGHLCVKNWIIVDLEWLYLCIDPSEVESRVSARLRHFQGHDGHGRCTGRAQDSQSRQPWAEFQCRGWARAYSFLFVKKHHLGYYFDLPRHSEISWGREPARIKKALNETWEVQTSADWKDKSYSNRIDHTWHI